MKINRFSFIYMTVNCSVWRSAVAGTYTHTLIAERRRTRAPQDLLCGGSHWSCQCL